MSVGGRAHREGNTQAPAGGAARRARSPARARSTPRSCCSPTVAALAVFGPRMLASSRTSSRDGLAHGRRPDNALARLGRDGAAPRPERARPRGRARSRSSRWSPACSRTSRRCGRGSRTAAIKPSFSKLNPLTGLKRVFGMNALVECGKAIVKTVVVGGVAFFAVWPELPSSARSSGSRPTALPRDHGRHGDAHRDRAPWRALLVLAVLDYVWQRHRLEKSLRMTKEEVKQEARQSRHRPRGARRRSAAGSSRRARRRMMADVPTADVVVVEPDPLRRRAPLRRHEAGAGGRREGRRPRRRRDPRAAARARRADRLEPAARARALPRRRGRPDDPRGASSPPSPRCSRSSTARRGRRVRAREAG